MKKISLYITILFRKTINEKIDATQLAQEIFNGIIKRKDPLRTLELIKALEVVFEEEMKKEEKRCSEICRSVNTKWQKEPVKVYNLYTDTRVEDLQVKYELLSNQ
jgi:flagellar motility protein MotE (MotC chaperone)